MKEVGYLNEFFSQSISSQSDYVNILVNFILCVVMSFILRSFYVKRSFSLMKS